MRDHAGRRESKSKKTTIRNTIQIIDLNPTGCRCKVDKELARRESLRRSCLRTGRTSLLPGGRGGELAGANPLPKKKKGKPKLLPRPQSAPARTAGPRTARDLRSTKRGPQHASGDEDGTRRRITGGQRDDQPGLGKGSTEEGGVRGQDWDGGGSQLINTRQDRMSARPPPSSRQLKPNAPVDCRMGRRLTEVDGERTRERERERSPEDEGL